MRIIRLLWDRLNCILAWPLLLIVDIGVAASRFESWKEARKYSNGELKKVWNRYALSTERISE